MTVLNMIQLIILNVIICMFFKNQPERELVYAVIIDAGSTSSRVLAVAFERNSSKPPV